MPIARSPSLAARTLLHSDARNFGSAMTSSMARAVAAASGAGKGLAPSYQCDVVLSRSTSSRDPGMTPP